MKLVTLQKVTRLPPREFIHLCTQTPVQYGGDTFVSMQALQIYPHDLYRPVHSQIKLLELKLMLLCKYKRTLKCEWRKTKAKKADKMPIYTFSGTKKIIF